MPTTKMKKKRNVWLVYVYNKITYVMFFGVAFARLLHDLAYLWPGKDQSWPGR